MYLKSLTLKGFKSFADRTRMVFDPGLTVVVGPNGSGKSNISDSILWVLGEQSAKHLRGQAMEDVVFAGSSARKPVGVAEVDLVLDNSDHVLPVDFDEVAITRRMYRSGESEYLINGAPSRLLDIQDILHDSGLGKETHSIISQGKLDAILMSRPEERRSLIEEAAGISKHKRRKERSVRKLAGMDQHLQRALDHQREVRRQLRPLERQVDRAQRFNEISARVRELSISLAVDDLRHLQAQWGEVESAEREANAQLELTDFQLKERQRELDKLQAMLEEKGLFVGDLSEQRRRCQTANERIDAQMRLLDEKGRNMVQRLSELYDSTRRSESRSEQCRRELDEARQEREAVRGEREALSERMDEANERLKVARVSRRRAEDELSRANAQLRSQQRERDQLTVALAKARDALDSARVQDDLFAERLRQLTEATQQSQAEAQAAQARVDENRAALDAARADEARLRADGEAAREALAQAQRLSREAHGALSSALAEIRGLERAAATEENRTPIAARLAERAGDSGDIVARVAELIDVPDELSDLVERLLAERMRGFVARDEAALLRVGALATSLTDAGGQVTIVSPDEAADVAADEGLEGYALVGRERDVDGTTAVSSALLGDVRVVDDLAQAIEASRRDAVHVYVTPAGDQARRGREVVVGRPQGASSGLLATQRSLRELREQMQGLEDAAAAADEGLEAAETRLAEARRVSEEASREVARLSGEASSVISELARIKQALERSQSERDRVEAQRAQVASQAGAARETLERCTCDLERAEDAIDDLNERVSALNDECDAARRGDRLAHEETNSCQVALARTQERARYLETRCGTLEREAQQLDRALAVSRDTQRGLEAMHLRIAPLHELYTSLQEVARQWAARLRDKASLAEADSASLRRTIEEARASVARAQQAYTQALGAVSEVKVAKGRLDVQVSGAINAITSHEGVVLEDALLLPEPQDRGADESELARLRKSLADIGPVNQVALEEYTSLKEHADYVDAQVADLQHARDALTKIISAIDRKMRNGFVDTFNAVDKNFREIFGMLFPGGSGHLEMTDPDDPDQTGIEVIAQPRGKRVGKMSLLSGGERSLTALGLLFAVYTTRTVPFYVLDEVEAALDDSNLDRLLDAIDKLRQRTQLIVISHQRRTMERADVLYGVSMQADGVSRVISQRLGEALGSTRQQAAAHQQATHS